MSWGPLWGDYTAFHKLAVETGDVDPVYPVLQRLIGHTGSEGMAWLSLLHVAYYDLGSAIRAYHLLGGPRPARDRLDAVLRLPTGTERRAHRSPRQLLKHLVALIELGEHFGSHLKAVHALADPRGRGVPSYVDFFGGMLSIYGNGRWAAYKSCELFSHSMLMPELLPTDMGMRHSSGPRHGLHLLDPSLPTNESAPALRKLDAAAERLVADLNWQGIEANMATAETTLCDFHSLVSGRYYVGHDIDQMGDQLRRALRLERELHDGEPEDILLLQALAAGKTLFGPYWDHSIDRERRKVYQRTGIIAWRGSVI